MDIKKYDQGKGARFNITFLVLCLCGQLCWNVENQWFNTFLYRKICQDVSYVTAMVILSATLTCISTFIFGAYSDRKGKRKNLLGWGYIIWGICTYAVGLCEYIMGLEFSSLEQAAIVAATSVVILDGIMSFVGSIAYDATFNAWTNDHTTEKNKGFIGTIYGIMPVIATILGTVIGGEIIKIGGIDTGNYQLLFGLMGTFVTICGILTLFVAKDKSTLKPQVEGTLFHQATTAFRFKELKKLPNLKEMLLACIVICVYFISFNFYFVHLGNWAIFELGFNEGDFGLIEGISMIFGIILAFPVSKLIDKDRIPLVCVIGLVTSFIGLLIIYFFVNGNTVDPTTAFSVMNIPVIVACFFFGTGEILMTEACMIWVRGLFPEDKRGQFEGLRCVFFVWVPMLIGTLCGDAIIKALGNKGVDPVTNMVQYYPPADLFLWASFVVLATFIPLFFAAKVYNKRIKAKKEALANGIVDTTLFDAIPDDETIEKAKEVK